MCRPFLATFLFVMILAVPVMAQKNEISFSAGGGSLIGANENKPASAYTFAYTRNLTDRWAVEGALEFFFVNVPNFGSDDYSGVQAAVLYHFRSEKDQRLVPYLTAAIGNTSTDPTEIPSEIVIRMGGGIKYFFGQQGKFGLRFEVRNEIIGKENTIFYPPARVNFPSARIGIIYRF